MPPTDPPIDVTDILHQPREFAQKLARVERERAELIETVARLRAECNDAQAETASYRAQQKSVNDAAYEAIDKLDATHAEVARLTERANKSARALELWAHDADQFSQRTADGQALISDDDLTAVKTIAAALRQPAPAPGQE